jgi:uncharacterized protein (DUF1810 family)
MAQVKIYGLKGSLSEKRESLSNAIHESLMEAFGLPENKKFQRFIMLDENDFIYPDDRSIEYTIIENYQGKHASRTLSYLGSGAM